MTALDAVAVALAIIAFALVSGRVATWPVTMPMVFVAFGTVTALLGWVQVSIEAEGVELLGEVALAVILFGDAVRIDVRALRREVGLPARVLGIGLPLTLALGALIGWLLLPGIGFVEAALIAAVLTPTDAALGQAVVEDQAVPQRVRQGLNVESGLNDGLVLPAVVLLVALVTGAQQAPGFWVGFVVQQIGLALLIGAAVGGVGGWLVRQAMTHDWITGLYAQLATAALAVLALAGASASGANGFIAAFVGGLVYGVVAGRERADHLDEYTEDTGRLLALVTFFLFGNVFLAELGSGVTWRVLLYAGLILTVARMLPVAIAVAGLRVAWPTVLFVGWFGPRGIASILFGLILLREGIPAAEQFFDVVTVTVTASIVLHGATAAWGARTYGAWFSRRSDEHAAMSEAKPVTSHPLRWRR